jgi:hypothetical protein
MAEDLFFDEDRKYSFNRIIRLVTGFPEDKPLPCRYEHGHTPSDDKPVNDLKSAKRLMLVFNKRRLKIWQKYSTKKAVIFGSPFVRYRRMKGIQQAADAHGTVAFPSHSIARMESIFDRNEYCKKLKELAPEFHPVRVCVHEHDILRGLDGVYADSGFEVVNAGPREDPQFVDRFYGILRNCKYATSNAFGSYLFYSVEMGIPFFIYGPEPYSLHDSKGKRQPKLLRIREHEYGKYIEDLFATYPDVRITDEQRQAVMEEVGVEDAIDPKELYQLLMSNYKRQRICDAIRLPLRQPKKFLKQLLCKA